jgi:hypothetical protein
MVLWSMTLANAMILIDQTAVPLALPNVMQDFAVGSQQVQWVLNASLLPLAGLLVLGGRLGDMFGVLLACRVLQRAGGALMLTLAKGDDVGRDQRGGVGSEVGDYVGDLGRARDVDQLAPGGYLLAHGVGDPARIGNRRVHHVRGDSVGCQFQRR